MRRHRFDPWSFAFGLTFVATAILGLADRLDAGLPELRWVVAGGLVVLGLGLLLTSRTEHREE